MSERFRISDEWLENLEDRAIIWDAEALEPVEFDRVEVRREGENGFEIQFYGLADDRDVSTLEIVDRRDYEVLIHADDRVERVIRAGESFIRSFKFEDPA